jgi:hypothetical protein
MHNTGPTSAVQYDVPLLHLCTCEATVRDSTSVQQPVALTVSTAIQPQLLRARLHCACV